MTCITSIPQFPYEIVPNRISNGYIASASNLPESSGSSGRLIGSLQALRPIKMFYDVSNLLINQLEPPIDLTIVRAKLLDTFPRNEKDFKKYFDEYSQDVSYRQQYLDKNAFLVYYTKGFDGPNRQSIEINDESEILQTKQYGFRNDAWISFKDAIEEIDYLIESKTSDTSDLKKSLTGLVDSLNSYLSLAPEDQKKSLGL